MAGDSVQLNRHARVAERLSPVDRTLDLHPWRRAQALTRCFLYWMPVSCFPIAAQERAWLMEFFNRFVELAATQFELRGEAFLNFKTVEELRIPFIKTASEFSPILGWTRQPGSQLVAMPPQEEIKEILRSGNKFDVTGIIQDRCYWFLKKVGIRQREIFFGHGGFTILFLKADPATKPPRLPFTEAMRKQCEQIQVSTLEDLMAGAFAMKDGFLAKSKQLFGAGLEDAPGFRGIPFILPQLCTEDFFNRPAEECESWFQLFDIYIGESSSDKGILLASKTDLEEKLIALLTQMRQDGFDYPTR